MASHPTGSGPWKPMIWSLGGLPEKKVDVPVTSVFLLLYIIGAAIHMTIFQRNRKRGHKFLFNGMLFGFCMARITTSVLRIATVCKPDDVPLAIAAQVFLAVGVVLIFIVNLFWAQRILRAHHASVGWHAATDIAFRILFILILFVIVILITALVQSYYTLRPRTHTIDRDLLLFGTTFLTIIGFLPILIIGLALAFPRSHPIEKFGQGRHRTKLIVLLAGSALCTAGAAFRCGTLWKDPVPLFKPEPGYFSKACFYVFNFVLEVVVVYMYAIMRVDLRFWIPDGAKGPGSYKVLGERGATTEKNADESGSESAVV